VVRRWAEGKENVGMLIAPTAQLSSLIEGAVRLQRQGRRSTVAPDTRREHERYETALTVRFAGLPELASAWATNICRGGLFVRCSDPPPLHSTVRLSLVLPESEVVELSGTVVHRLTANAASARPEGPGVGLAFTDPGGEEFGVLEALLDRFSRRASRVLLVHGETAWRDRLSAALAVSGLEVECVRDGRAGLLALIDRLFDIDLVVLDLEASNVGGSSLIERIRVRGGELGLKMMLLLDEPPSIEAKGSGTLWIASKRQPLDALVKRVCAQVGKLGPGPGA
jgi:CheY-like chemotaxis protein